MNLSEPKPRRPRASSFNSVEEFWSRVDSCPEQFHFLDATEMLAFSNEVSLAIEKREKNGRKMNSKNGRKREETGGSRDAQFKGGNGEPGVNGHAGSPNGQTQKVGPGNPPKEHQFKNGNPGGPGRPKGNLTLRKMIRAVLYEPEFEGKQMAAVVNALFSQTIKGNTHAIRIICEQSAPRRKR